MAREERALTEQGLPGRTQPAAGDRVRPSCLQQHHLHAGLTQGRRTLCQEVTAAQRTVASRGTPHTQTPAGTWPWHSCRHHGWQGCGTSRAAPMGAPQGYPPHPRAADFVEGRDWRKKGWRGQGQQTPQDQRQGIPIFPVPPVPGTIPGVTHCPCTRGGKGHPDSLCPPPGSCPAARCLHASPACLPGTQSASVPRRLWDCPPTPTPGRTRLPWGLSGPWWQQEGPACCYLFF